MLNDIISAVNDALCSYTIVVGGTSAFIESTPAQVYKRKGFVP